MNENRLNYFRKEIKKVDALKMIQGNGKCKSCARIAFSWAVD